MSMLELISKASATSDSRYPILLNPDPILLNLKPKFQQSDDAAIIKRVEGWAISQTDKDIIELGQKFYRSLNIKLLNPKSFNKAEFITLLNSYLEKNSEKAGISLISVSKDTKVLIQKLGFLIGDAVLGLILEACLGFEIWEILETLIINRLIDGLVSNNLINNLVDKNRSDLICLCLKHVLNLQVSDILLVLKFFLSPSKDGYITMDIIRKEWEMQTVSAIEAAVDKSKSSSKDAAVLLVMAHDEFTINELCLHYLLASTYVDDVMFSACIGKLNGLEIMRFVRYLKKWLVKYQKFPQASSVSRDSVPSLEHVVKCFGLVIDEHFTSLVMHPEFREEVESVELVVSSLALEARVCCNLASLCAGN